jgi:hypothetical protein
MIGEAERELARELLRAQSQGFGVTPENDHAWQVLKDWESRGWADSRVDADGDGVFVLTFEGQAALLHTPGEKPS